jgi:hypothetical protein
LHEVLHEVLILACIDYTNYAKLDIYKRNAPPAKRAIRKIMRVQIKTGSEWHTTERRAAIVTVNGQPIYQILKALAQEWEEVGNKGKHGKWCIAEYELPVGAKIEFFATANGRDKIAHSFVVGGIDSIDAEGYSYGGDTCGWIVSI